VVRRRRRRRWRRWQQGWPGRAIQARQQHARTFDDVGENLPRALLIVLALAFQPAWVVVRVCYNMHPGQRGGPTPAAARSGGAIVCHHQRRRKKDERMLPDVAFEARGTRHSVHRLVQ
jgi:hypothetical protein